MIKFIIHNSQFIIIDDYKHCIVLVDAGIRDQTGSPQNGINTLIIVNYEL